MVAVAPVHEKGFPGTKSLPHRADVARDETDMPSLLLHAAAIDRLAAQSDTLPRRMATAVVEDLEYARLGAFLPDLPLYGNLKALRLEPATDKASHFAHLFHHRAPVTLGLKLAELVAMGALVGTEAGHAFLCGYFTHLTVDRALSPREFELAERFRRPNHTVGATHDRIEWLQGLWYLQSLHGKDLAGDPLIRKKLRVHKRAALARGLGRGFYELIRTAAVATFGEAPSKPEVDGWMRGLHLHALMLGSPVGRVRSLSNVSALERKELFKGPEIDWAADVERAVAEAQQVLARVHRYMQRGLFSPRARQRFLEGFPEGSVSANAA